MEKITVGILFIVHNAVQMPTMWTIVSVRSLYFVVKEIVGGDIGPRLGTEELWDRREVSTTR